MSELRQTDELLDPQMVRTVLANDRTFLAWMRTSLALVAAGVAVSKILPPLEIIGGRRVLGVIIVLLGAATGSAAFIRWRDNDQLIRAGRGIKRGREPQVMAAIMGLAVTVGFIIVVVTAR